MEQKTIKTGMRCYLCNNFEATEENRWYHGDQDDLLCDECALKTKHNDTSIAGFYVRVK